MQYYLTTTESGHANGDHVLAPQEYEQFLEHQRDFTVRRSFVQTARKTKAPIFREAVVQVSEWLATYPPVHDTDGLTRGLVYGGKWFYNLGSATVHGYKWMHESPSVRWRCSRRTLLTRQTCATRSALSEASVRRRFHLGGPVSIGPRSAS
ncbi:hypothetical protein [Rhodococcus sp. JS3073]|uniref:hypothetical protein n=1 Tax=Rhodococcus sp. JS3073 TaxID=3002901 RepID=UPI002285BCA5|nr:hypothetical protein [Rhodococcus sp. JS3073]WAM15474.1 hypothetical protein OYT95_02050 [Rhodococcus sp. JS3073]